MPRSAMVYLRRACLRSVRSPWSRWTRDLFGDVDDLVDRAETEDIGDARVGLDLVVRHAEAAADGDVEAEEFLAGLIGDGDEAEVVRVDVDVVARRDGDDDLEFAREIAGAVDGLGLGFAAGDEFIGRPRSRGRRGCAARGGRLMALRDPERLGVEGALLGVGIAHDVAVDVAAGRERVEQLGVHPVDGRARGCP
jgi:hypothetical protein